MFLYYLTRLLDLNMKKQIDLRVSFICASMALQVISQGAISAPMYSLKGPSMIQSLYPTAFPLKHQQKVCKSSLVCLLAFISPHDVIS